MNQEFFKNLPPEIIIDILSRLPVRTIVSCKCVCKSWLHLLETHEFAKSHLSKSVPGLAVYHYNWKSVFYEIFEFGDGNELELHERQNSLVTKFSLPYHGWMYGSANGLLLLVDVGRWPECLYICNPITRDYIQLHSSQVCTYSYPRIYTYGFGASKMTGQHKVVKIFSDFIYKKTGELLEVTKFECQVYTVGTGSWRIIVPDGPLMYKFHVDAIGAFLNGYLHWLVSDLKGSPWISCFDLETELFSTFSLPSLLRHGRYLEGLFALGDCLCLCDITSDDEIVLWLMKEYGVERSWTKEFVISKIPNFPGDKFEVVRPIKVFEDGILMASEDEFLFYYCSKTKTTHKINVFPMQSSIGLILHTSSFLSLKTFAMEKVSSF